MERGRDHGEGGGGSGGQGKPPLEARVTALEERMDRIEVRLQRIELQLAEVIGELRQIPKAADHAALRAEVAEIKGRLINMPTTWTLISFAIGSCLASAGLAFAIARMMTP